MEEVTVKKKKTTLKYIGDAIFYLIVAFLTFIIVLSLTVTNGMIKTLGFGWYMVASDSMEPLIMTKDMVVATKVNPDDLKPGDIIIFETWVNLGNNGFIYTPVIHYFYEIDEFGHVKTYSQSKVGIPDSNESKFDPWTKSDGSPHFVTKDDILGKHVFTIPTAGFVEFMDKLFESPLGIFLIIVNILLLGLIIYVLASKKKKPNEASTLETSKDAQEEINHDQDLG